MREKQQYMTPDRGLNSQVTSDWETNLLKNNNSRTRESKKNER